MINCTDAIIFLKQKQELSLAIGSALNRACQGLRESMQCLDAPSHTFTAKTFCELTFVRVVEEALLSNVDKLDEQYIQDLFQYSLNSKRSEPELYLRVVNNYNNGKRSKTFEKALPRGVQLTLLALHTEKAIALPWRCVFPRIITRKGLPTDVALSCLPEIFRAIRLTRLDKVHTPVAKPSSKARDAERLSNYGSRILMQVGWMKPEDGNLNDMIEAVKARPIDAPSVEYPFRRVVDVLQECFGDRFPMTVADYEKAMKELPRRDSLELHPHKRASYQLSVEALRQKLLSTETAESDERILLYAAGIDITDASSTKLLELSKSLTDFDVELAFSDWTRIQRLSLIGVRGTSASVVKDRVRALRYFNIYLFCYLPLWFNRHPETKLLFPANPSLFSGGIFGSRLEICDFPLPATVEQFIRQCSHFRKHMKGGAANILSDLRLIFTVIERHAREWKGCEGFTQPLNATFTGNLRSNKTSKTLIPNEILPLLLQVVEAWKQWIDLFVEKIFNGLESKWTDPLDVVSQDNVSEMANCDRTLDLMENFFMSGKNLVDVVGFCPLVFLDKKPFVIDDVALYGKSEGQYETYFLRFIPNICNFGDHRLTRQDGTLVWLPRPHLVNQIITLIHTGIRGNHIRWLDVDKFDEWCRDDGSGVYTLWVNTDKAKAAGWPAWVAPRVIQVLRDQRAWRNRANIVGFDNLQYYNDYENDVYPRFLPLFSYYTGGLPNNDAAHLELWSEMLAFTQSMLLDVGVEFAAISRLLPAGFSFSEPGLEERLKATFPEGPFEENARVILKYKSKITPHSTRTTVVSVYSTMLPAEVIGTNLTGQTVPTVHFYSQTDEKLKEEVASMHQRTFGAAYGAQFRSALAGDISSFIVADERSSGFIRGLSTDLEATLASHGCIASRWPESEHDALDVIRETGARNIAANKTEVCVYGNVCPPDVIQRIGKRRCPLCPYALRSVDHLPAISSHRKSAAEEFNRVDSLLKAHANGKARRLTVLERKELQFRRDKSAEDAAQWSIIECVLGGQLMRLRENREAGRWVAQEPEMLSRALEKINAPDNATQYVLARLPEVFAYGGENESLNAQMEITRRRLLAGTGQIREALLTPPSLSPAFELLGVVRTVLEMHNLSPEEFLDAVKDDTFLELRMGRVPMLHSE